MESIIHNVLDLYYDAVDPRTKKLPLMDSPYIIAVIITSYLLFCCNLGPRFMKHRKPYELKNIIIAHNLFQILLSSYLSYKGTLVWKQFNWFCEPIDYSETPFTTKALSLGWWYAIGKITELLDTVFFVLRKKNHQISFLHVFHHTFMAVACWMGMRYFAGGHGTLFALLNSYVHVVMYTYYLIAGLGPQYQKYLWWKKHLTILQLVQFSIIFVHNFFPLFTTCSYPKGLNMSLLAVSSFFLVLFGNFYTQNYVRRRQHTGSNGKKLN